MKYPVYTNLTRFVTMLVRWWWWIGCKFVVTWCGGMVGMDEEEENPKDTAII